MRIKVKVQLFAGVKNKFEDVILFFVAEARTTAKLQYAFTGFAHV